MAPHLGTLPVELFEKIAEEEPSAYKALLLVTHDFATEVSRLFVLKHFTHQAYYLSESSLRLAIAIAGHPMFGKACKKITFLLDEPCSCTEAWQRSDDGKTTIPFVFSRKQQIQEAGFDKYSRFIQSGMQSIGLGWLFEALSKWGNLEEVELSLLKETPRQPLLRWNEAFTHDAEYSESDIVSSVFANSAFAIVVKAWARTGFQTPPKAFKIGTECWGIPQSPGDQVLHNFGIVIQNLIHVDLKFHDCFSPPTVGTMKALAKAATYAPCLRSLHCSNLDISEGEQPEAMVFFDGEYPQLEYLKMYGGSVDLPRLLPLVQKHKGLQLQRVDLEYTLITRTGLDHLSKEAFRKRLRQLLGLPGT